VPIGEFVESGGILEQREDAPLTQRQAIRGDGDFGFAGGSSSA